jgi:hypothetical protein
VCPDRRCMESPVSLTHELIIHEPVHASNPHQVEVVKITAPVANLFSSGRHRDYHCDSRI